MKKFSNRINESSTPSQLEMGIKVESEHGNIYEELEKWLESNRLEMPWTKKEFYKKIAQAHLKELPDYYTRLQKMEKD